jgi:hypothetical protein
LTRLVNVKKRIFFINDATCYKQGLSRRNNLAYFAVVLAMKKECFNINIKICSLKYFFSTNATHIKARLVRDKHSSLFCWGFSDEEYYNINIKICVLYYFFNAIATHIKARLVSDKHSSLFCWGFSHEERMF